MKKVLRTAPIVVVVSQFEDNYFRFDLQTIQGQILATADSLEELQEAFGIVINLTGSSEVVKSEPRSDGFVPGSDEHLSKVFKAALDIQAKEMSGKDKCK